MKNRRNQKIKANIYFEIFGNGHGPWTFFHPMTHGMKKVKCYE